MNEKVTSEALTIYLTKEVELHMNLMLAQRTINNLLFSVAPFLALGVIASNSTLVSSLRAISNQKFFLFIIFIICIYLFLGLIGAKIEEELWHQCNEWRRQIAKIHHLHGESAFEFSSKRLIIAYVSIFGSIGMLFSALLFLIKSSAG